MNIKNGSTCPICMDGSLTKNTKEMLFTYKDKTFPVPDYTVFSCANCGEDLVRPDDNKHIERKIINFQRRTDELLTPGEIKDIRKKLGYSQEKFAKILKVGAKNFARYESGLATQGRAMDWLLRVFRDNPETIQTIVPTYAENRGKIIARAEAIITIPRKTEAQKQPSGYVYRKASCCVLDFKPQELAHVG